LSGWPLRADRLHVSLHSLGDYRNGLPDSIVATATRAGERVVYHLFDVAFDRVESFPTSNRRRPLVLLGSDKLAELHDFQQAVGAAMNEVGLGSFVATNFNPHVTLLYDERLVVGPQFIAPVKWTVREFVLVHSLVGRTQHIHLARWPLAWRCP
jgi:2'-5' RNA ligase